MNRKFISFIDFTNLNDEDKYKLLILRENKIDKANEMLQLLHYKFEDEDTIHNEIEDIQKCLKEVE